MCVCVCCQEGYGTMSGVALHKGKWLNEVGVVPVIAPVLSHTRLCAPAPQHDVRRKLVDIHPVLKRSAQLQSARCVCCVCVCLSVCLCARGVCVVVCAPVVVHPWLCV